MPLNFVQRYAPGGELVTGTGIQYVNSTLNLEASPIYVDFDPTLWADAQSGVAYTLFTYSLLSGSASNLAYDLATLPPGKTSAVFTDNGSGTITVTFS